MGVGWAAAVAADGVFNDDDTYTIKFHMPHEI